MLVFVHFVFLCVWLHNGDAAKRTFYDFFLGRDALSRSLQLIMRSLLIFYIFDPPGGPTRVAHLSEAMVLAT